MECQVKEIIPLGSHDLFLGQIVAFHVKEEVEKEKAGSISPKSFLLSTVPEPMSTGILGNALAITVLPKANHDH
jgi:flavin reductase (DIM6/NTAB) family NADH-FMN oxidoreductase RutF